jgi:hypothetical protein
VLKGCLVSTCQSYAFLESRSEIYAPELLGMVLHFLSPSKE